MSIKTVNFKVDVDGITPNVEQFGGTMGDHRVTRLEFVLADELFNCLQNGYPNKNFYRFDIYDGGGGVHTSSIEPITNKTVAVELEEKHTRYGGKITAYLILTALSNDNETQIELYSFPVKLQLKNRPEGTRRTAENYESIAGIFENVKKFEEAAKSHADDAKVSVQRASSILNDVKDTVETTLEQAKSSGMFDGVSVTHGWDGTVLTVTSASGTSSADLKGEKGDAGKDAVTDQTYSPASENAQSGKAVASAISSKVNETDIFETKDVVINPTVTHNKKWIVNDEGKAECVDYTDSGTVCATEKIDISNTHFVKYVAYGTIFVINNKGYSMLITDANDNVLVTNDGANGAYSGEINLPYNAAYIVFNQGTSLTDSKHLQLEYTKVLSDSFKNKVDIYQGVEHEGEFLAVDDSGNLALTRLGNEKRPYMNFADMSDSDVVKEEAAFDANGNVITQKGGNYAITGYIKLFDYCKGYLFRSIDSAGKPSASSCYDVFWYDEDKNYIDYYVKSKNFIEKITEEDIPQNAKYMRCRIYRTTTNDQSIVDNFMVLPAWYEDTYKNKPEYFAYDGDGSDYAPNIINLNEFKGKTLAVIGDSIGTWEGHNASEIVIAKKDVGVTLSAFVTSQDVGTVIGDYTIQTSDIGAKLSFTPTANDIGKEIGKALTHGNASRLPWWYHLINQLGVKCNNVSYSGSSYCSHENNVDTYKNVHAWHESQINKCGTRIVGTMDRVAPDYIILARGVNDFSHWPYAKLSGISNDMVLPPNITDDVIDGGYGFEEALCLTISKLKAAYPKAKIYVCTITAFKRHGETAFPPYNKTNTLPQFNNAIRKIADYYSCGVIEMDKVVTWENLSEYTSDNTHPNNFAHQQMFRQALKTMLFN